MRSEAEMMELILTTAHDDSRIRAVIMNGSRVNPNLKPDIFQDYDIVYVVEEAEGFRKNYEWVKRFGEMMVMQLPDDMLGEAQRTDGIFSYLMQFTDGNRIDLTICPKSSLPLQERDSLSRLLLDKDGIIEPFPPPTDQDYLPKPPTAVQFTECCNEFWWVAPYVAKGLWRKELPYAKEMLDDILRKELVKVLTWYVGIKTEFRCNIGGYGKWLQQSLEPALWNRFLQCFADADYGQNWEALFAMCSLFRLVATKISVHFGYEYPSLYDEQVTKHLNHVRALPQDATSIY